jgi:Protein of unknown function (DUF2474)
MGVRSPSDRRNWPYRVGWLVLIWTASVAALGIVALSLRAIMSVAGLTTG